MIYSPSIAKKQIYMFIVFPE